MGSSGFQSGCGSLKRHSTAPGIAAVGAWPRPGAGPSNRAADSAAVEIAIASR
jgi:hypothetical protein